MLEKKIFETSHYFLIRVFVKQGFSSCRAYFFNVCLLKIPYFPKIVFNSLVISMLLMNDKIRGSSVEYQVF